MRKVLVFQHVPYEPLGILDPLLREVGLRIRYVNFGRTPKATPRLRGYAGLIVLGGPMSANDVAVFPHLHTERQLIAEALERKLPVLGICLGAQLLAAALGAPVTPNPVKEIGWHDLSLTPTGRRDPLLEDFQASERLFQWHGDTFAVPAGAAHLASSPTCAAQAFRYADTAYGLQFHLEADEPLIERWLTVPLHVEELSACAGNGAADRIRAETHQRIERSTSLARATFGRFISIAGWRRRSRRQLRSR